MNRQDKGGGDIVYNFVHNKKVKKIHVSEDVQTQLIKGRLAIVLLDDGYELVPTPVALKITERDAANVILLNDLSGAKTDEDAEDDPYADYKIPDDLM